MRLVSLNNLLWDWTSNALNMKFVHHSLQFCVFYSNMSLSCRAAELMTRTGSVVTLEVAKQGAIFHGLATLLSQPSPMMTRGKQLQHEYLFKSLNGLACGSCCILLKKYQWLLHSVLA